MKVKNVIDLLEKLSPTKYACDWDNVGLHTGHMENDVKRILITVDVNEAAVLKALEIKADMIIAHHPLIFHEIRKINEESAIGKRLLTLIENGIAVYCMHTNFDAVGGMAEEAANIMGIKDETFLEAACDNEGIGRVGTIEKAVTVKELCQIVKERFGLSNVVLYGNEDDVVQKIAICPGSGKDYIKEVILKGAKAYITGDISYHYGIDAVSDGLNIIDAGHYGIEHIFIDVIYRYLYDKLENVQINKMKIFNPQQYL